jgi:hypothetical protein
MTQFERIIFILTSMAIIFVMLFFELIDAL